MQKWQHLDIFWVYHTLQMCICFCAQGCGRLLSEVLIDPTEVCLDSRALEKEARRCQQTSRCNILIESPRKKVNIEGCITPGLWQLKSCKDDSSTWTASTDLSVNSGPSVHYSSFCLTSDSWDCKDRQQRVMVRMLLSLCLAKRSDEADLTCFAHIFSAIQR